MDSVFFVLGAIIGSFLNVCIHRMPREKSIVTPGSSCPHCDTPIRFYENIPLVSYLLLRGRCKSCGGSISARYFGVELLTAVLFVILFRALGLSFDLFVFLMFVSVLIVVSFIDFEFRIIPDTLSLGGLVAGLVLAFFRGPAVPSHAGSVLVTLMIAGLLLTAGLLFVWRRDFESRLLEYFVSLGGLLVGLTLLPFSGPPFTWWGDALPGILVGQGVLWAIAFVYELARKQEGMGGGDIKLLAMIGAFCGIKGVVFSLVSGSLVGSLVGIPLMIAKRADAKYALPFGPFLSAGAVLYVLAGERTIYAFINLISPR
jgi:leader peptidase (prepilin peptidase)/N-methyltransferase